MPMPVMSEKNLVPWWTASDGEVHKHLVGAVRRLDKIQTGRRDRNLLFLRAYSNFSAAGLSGGAYEHTADDGRIKANLIKAVIDTLSSRLGTIKPRVQFLTEGGDWEMKRRAKGLTKFVSGQFHHLRQYPMSRRVFQDAAIFGTGFQTITENDDCDDVYTESPFPDEILVDPIEARRADPVTFYRVMEVSKDVASATWPKYENVIRQSGKVRTGGYARSLEGLADPVDIIEAWRLPVGNKKGRRVMCTSAGTLVDEEWEDPFPPFLRYSMCDRPLGYFGIGVAEELRDIQVEINYLLQKIQHCMTLATTQIWARKNSINKRSFNNTNLAVREYNDTPPVVLNIQSLSAEFFTHVDRLWAKGFEIVGVSQMSASGLKPPGLNSGKAQREHQDIQSERFLSTQQAYEEFHVEVARRMVHEARKLDKKIPGGYRVIAKGDKGLENLRWRDVSLDRDKYIIQAWPTSFLPKTPAGKLETIQELGQISPEFQQEMMAQLDFPDTEDALSRINAPGEMADMLFCDMMEHDEEHTPEPRWPLALINARMTMNILRAQIDGAPEEKIERVRIFLEQSEALLDSQKPDTPPPGAMPGQDPMMPPPEAMMPPAA